MKVGIKTIELDDYKEVKYEVEQLTWFTHEFRVQTPSARIDATDTIGHTHKTWEWARALHAIRVAYGDNRKIKVLDVGSAYSLLGPALAYLGYDLTEAEVDGSCGEHRELINKFLSAFNTNPIHWKQAGFGSLQERCGGIQYEVVMSISTIEHIDLWLETAAWKEMAELVKPGGLFIMTMDCMAEAKKGYMYDDVRWTNYSMEIIREKVKEMKSYGFKPLGKEDYEFHGNFVNDYSFAGIHMVKNK